MRVTPRIVPGLPSQQSLCFALALFIATGASAFSAPAPQFGALGGAARRAAEEAKKAEEAKQAEEAKRKAEEATNTPPAPPAADSQPAATPAQANSAVAAAARAGGGSFRKARVPLLNLR